MKKLFSIFVVSACGIFAVLTADAQKSSSYAITVKFSVQSNGDISAQNPPLRENVYTIFGNKLKVTDPRGITQIIDCDDLTATLLFNIKGSKSGYMLHKEVFEDMFKSKQFSYAKEKDTMMICGYVCTRYNITIYDTGVEKETKVIAYTTTEIGANSNINKLQYPGLTGFPLYLETEEDGVKIIEKAVEIKKTKVKSTDFSIPPDYKMFSSEEEWEKYIQTIFDKE